MPRGRSGENGRGKVVRAIPCHTESAVRLRKTVPPKIKASRIHDRMEGKAGAIRRERLRAATLRDGGRGYFDPYPRVREKIDQGRKKFKEYKDFCCALALYNPDSPLVRLEDWHIMLGAMYGDSGYTFPVNIVTGIGDADARRPAFLGRGKMLRPKLDTPQNTTIAALITLTVIHPYRVRLVEMIGASLQTGTRASLDELKTALLRDRLDPELVIPRVIVWHNAFARLPFPPDLFCGPYDTHFGVVRGEDGVFNAVTFRSGSLPESVKA